MMMEMILALESIGKGVFLVLVNTSLQVTLLICLVWSMIRIFRPRSAVARYYLWFLAVFGILALPLLSVFLPGISIPMTRSEETTISPIYARSITVGESTVAADMPGEASAEIDQQTTQKRSFWTNVSRLRRQFGLISIISLAWFVIALSMLFRLMGSYFWLRRFRRKSQRVVEGPVLEIISRLRERMSLTRRIDVFISSEIHSPTSFGLFSTAIILPESLTNNGDEELEMVLSHEMAHAKRHDYLVNLFQRILQSVLFFHPLFHIANRRLAREREHICDDWVIEMTGRRDDYAECLVGLVENAYYLRPISMAIMEHRHNISRRVDMIIDNSRRTITKISRKARISIFLMACILLPMLAATQLVYTVELKEPVEVASVTLDTDEGKAEKTIEQEKKEAIAGIPDANLAAAIREALGKPEGAITKDDLLSITELEAPDNNISDIAGIERCVNLERLVLGATEETNWESSNQIEDISLLKRLTKLVHLNLRDNGKISDIDPLSDLTNLTELHLGHNQISDVTSLVNLTNLTVLHLSDNQVSGVTPVSSLTNLNKLWLHQNQIADVAPLTGLTNLTLLQLAHNQISDVMPLSNLTNLTELDLYDNQISSDVIPLSDLTNLTVLRLGGNQISDVTPLSNLTNLKELSAWGNQISDIAPLANLTNLTELDLGSNQISDVMPLSNLADLTKLGLYSNPISDVTPLSDLTNLTWLHLADNQVSDLAPLSNLTDLTFLHVSRNQIDDVTPLAKLTNLTKLYLYGNPISDVTPLSGLTNLEMLGLWETHITDPSPLSNLTNLTILDLGYSQIRHVSGLSKLTNLTYLGLSGNQIVDITPLVDDPGLGEGSWIDLSVNPLNDEAYSVHIPELRGRGVVVQIPFVDLNLEAAFREAIGKPDGAITKIDLQSITKLEAPDNNISDITGIERCVNLESLVLGNWGSSNGIEDIRRLGWLTKLVYLNLRDNKKVSNASPLANLASLKTLVLDGNQVSDVAPLSNLTNLTKLHLAANQISDIKSLVGNKGLSIGDEVDLEGNPLNDEAYKAHIPALEERGVRLKFDPNH